MLELVNGGYIRIDQLAEKIDGFKANHEQIKYLCEYYQVVIDNAHEGTGSDIKEINGVYVLSYGLAFLIVQHHMIYNIISGKEFEDLLQEFTILLNSKEGKENVK